MKSAAAIVNKLLEMDYADFSEQEKPEHWEEVPYGFIATGPDRRIEAKWEAARRRYRLTVYWTDEYTGKERACPAGLQSVANPESYLAQMKAKYEADGWNFKLL